MKNILITSTSSGFGKATTDYLTELGYNVVFEKIYGQSFV